MAATPSLAGRIAPLFLRLAVGIIFVLAGLGKFFADMEVSGADAALLANHGVRFNIPTPTTPPETPPNERPPNGKPPNGKPPNDKPGSDKPPSGGEAEKPGHSGPPPLLRLQGAPGRAYVAEDFRTPTQVQRVYGIALGVHRAAEPPARADGTRPMALLPRFMAARPWPAAMAWTVGLVEIVAGVFVLVGLITRLSAFLLAGIMVGAIWLTEIGPAVQSGNTVLLFLPNRPAFDGGAWMVFYLQFSLLMSSLSLLFTGAGAIALDTIWLSPRPVPRSKAIEVRQEG